MDAEQSRSSEVMTKVLEPYRVALFLEYPVFHPCYPRIKMVKRVIVNDDLVQCPAHTPGTAIFPVLADGNRD